MRNWQSQGLTSGSLDPEPPLKEGREGGKIDQARKDLGLESDLLTGRGRVVGDRCTTKGRGTIRGTIAVGGVRILAGAGWGELSVQTSPAGTVPLGPLSRMEKGKGKERSTAPQPHKFGALTLILQLWKQGQRG